MQGCDSMTLHQNNPHKRPDSDFINGDLSYLKEGNACRLLDGRRTPGIIESIDYDVAMFQWKITDFEDEGRYWELPFEKISQFQFLKDSDTVNEQTVNTYKQVIKFFKGDLSIPVNPLTTKETDNYINKLKDNVHKWLSMRSDTFKNFGSLNITNKKGNKNLFNDLKHYMKANNLYDLELATTNQICLNPSSGELIKGMLICLAELGIVMYHGPKVRKQETFSGPYSKERRKKYLCHRLAFIRAIFENIGMDEMTVYRGMSSPSSFKPRSLSIISTTASYETGQAFFGDATKNKVKSAYLIKLTVPISHILFTYLETSEFNRQYLEQEVVLLNIDGLAL